ALGRLGNFHLCVIGNESSYRWGATRQQAEEKTDTCPSQDCAEALLQVLQVRKNSPNLLERDSGPRLFETNDGLRDGEDTDHKAYQFEAAIECSGFIVEPWKSRGDADTHERKHIAGTT